MFIGKYVSKVDIGDKVSIGDCVIFEMNGRGSYVMRNLVTGKSYVDIFDDYIVNTWDGNFEEIDAGSAVVKVHFVSRAQVALAIMLVYYVIIFAGGIIYELVK